MGRRKKSVESNNLRLAVIFAVLVGSLIFISLLFKAFLLIRQSTFDGVHRFTIAISSSTHTKTIISASPETQSLSLLVVNNDVELSHMGTFLKIPIDGSIMHNRSLLDNSTKDAEKILLDLVLGYKDSKTNLTIIDMVRLWYFAKTLSPSSISTATISESLEEARVDKISYSLFSDYSLTQEKTSIQIINGTNVSGLGNRLARLINNMGGNVVVVSTSDNPVRSSNISYSLETKTYTVEKLEKTLRFPSSKTNRQGVSEVTITIGEDHLNSLVF